MESEFIVAGVQEDIGGRKILKLEDSNLTQGQHTLNAAATTAGASLIFQDAGCMNPLEIDDVLYSLFKFLDRSSLVSARLVSSKWRTVSTMVWVQRSSVAIAVPPNYHGDTEESRTKYVEAFDSFRGVVPSTLQIRNIKIKSLDDIEVLQSLEVLGSEIRELVFKPPSPTSFVQYTEIMMTDSLWRLLQLLPNLKVLTTDHLNFVYIQGSMSEFLDKLESLDDLRLCCPASYSMFHIPEIGQKLRALKCLTLKEDQVGQFLYLYVSHKIPWKIEQLTLTLTPNVPMEITRPFLNMIAGTLKELKIYFLWHWQQHFMIDPETWVDNWYLPVTLDSLEKLSVYERAQDAMTNSQASRRTASATWRTLAAAVQLKKLKTLEITAHLAGRLETIVNDWRENRGRLRDDGTRDDLSSLSLQNLYIVCGDLHWNDPSCFTHRTINLFPNVTHLNLELSLVEPSPSIITGVLQKWTQLTSLTLTLWPGRNLMENKFGNVDWDILLTGLDKNCGGNDGANDESMVTVEQREEPSLRNLKKLRHLKIHCNTRNLVSDNLIYNELIHLKSLRTLSITGVKFSTKALKNLAHALGPDVNIQTDNTRK